MQVKRLLGYILIFCYTSIYAVENDSLQTQKADTDIARHIGYSLIVSPGKAAKLDSWQKRNQLNDNALSVAAEVNYSPLPQDSNAFARDFNYPIFSLGLKYCHNDVTMHRSEDITYNSRLGNQMTVYGSITRPILHNRSWMVDYMLGTGIGYSRTKYNKYNNVDNELLGTNFLIYFTAGFHATYRIADNWGLLAGVEFYHHSNGALHRPNKGANTMGPTIGIRYMPYYKEVVTEEAKAKVNEPFQKKFFANVAVGVGGKTLNEDWKLTQYYLSPNDPNYRTAHFHFYNAYSIQADIMYRYARRWASGIGADLFYGTYADRVREIEENNLLGDSEQLSVSPWSYALAFKHNVYYGNLSLRMSLGYYLYRHMGTNAKEIERPYYERIGLHYSFPKLRGLSIGFFVKAHMLKADFTELSIGYPIEL